MKTKMFSAMLAALTLATASIGGITASAEEIAVSEDETAETTAVDEEENTAETTVTNANSETDPNVTTKTLPDFYGDPYYDTGGNASLIKSETIICNTEEMQFIAVTTKDGHVFYVLINYSAENSEDQVFFLNNVSNTYGHSN